MWIKLGDKEHATILAALRYWQREGLNSGGHEITSIATDGGEFEPLSAEKIEALCEDLTAKISAKEESFVEAAMEWNQSDDVEVTDDAVVSLVPDGAWVMAWVYVPKPETEGDEDEEPAPFVAKFWDDFGGSRSPDDTWSKDFPSAAEAQKFFSQQIDEAIKSDNGIGYASAELCYGDEVIARYARVK